MTTRSRDRAGEGVADRAALARRVVRDNALAIGAANVVGGVLVAVFLIWVVPIPVSRGLGKNANLILAVSYLTAASIAGQMLGRRTGAPVLAWLRAGRQPTPHEREVTLRQPLLQARNVAVLWGVAAVLFALVNASYSAALALQIG